MFFPVTEWFAAFILTVIVEAPLVLVLLRRVEPNLLRLVILTLFANLATHAVTWYVITQVLLVGTVEYVLVAELWAVGAEAVFFLAALRGLSPRQAVVVAAMTNAASFVVGRLIGVWSG